MHHTPGKVFAVGAVAHMIRNIHREDYLQSGYRWRVMRWKNDGSAVQTVAYYKRLWAAKRRCDQLNAQETTDGD